MGRAVSHKVLLNCCTQDTQGTEDTRDLHMGRMMGRPHRTCRPQARHKALAAVNFTAVIKRGTSPHHGLLSQDIAGSSQEAR